MSAISLIGQGPRPLRRWTLCANNMQTLPNYHRDRRTIAFHEAGHVLFDKIMELPVISAELFDDGDERRGQVLVDPGYLQTEKPPLDGAPLSKELMETASVVWASVHVAGIISETILHGIDVNGWLKLDTHDWRIAKALLLAGFGHERALYYTQCVARYILVQRWDLVKVIADELARKGKLNTDDISRLCTGLPQQDWATLLDKW